MIEKKVVVNATIQAVWEAWTTESGVRAFFAPEAKIDLRVGGHYEMYFMLDAPTGSRGGEGCTVRDVREPNRLGFTWNFPPTIPSLRDNRRFTEVCLNLAHAADNQTEVSMVQSGWQSGPDWEEGYAYFDRAWDLVLDRLKRRFQSGPIDWNNPDP